MHAIIRITVKHTEALAITRDDGRCGSRVHVTRRWGYVAERAARAGTASDLDGHSEDGGKRGQRGMVVPLVGTRSGRPVRRVGHTAGRAQMSGPAALRRGADVE
jgi:hypothetical protein